MTAVVTQGSAAVRVTLDGEVRSPGEALSSTEIAGTVVAAPARIGARVHKGDTLVALDARPFRIALAQADAVLAQADAAVAVKRAAFDRVRVATTRLMSVAERDPGAISERETEDARLALSEAEAALRAAEAERDVRTASKQAAELDVSRTTLRAPVDGIVSRQEARLGARLAAGTLVSGVVSSGALEVTLDVGEVWAGRIVPGAIAHLQVPSRPEITAEGIVGGVVPAADGASRNQRARVDLPDPPPGLLPGLAVRAVVEVETLADALQVPRDAVASGSVFVVSEGKARKVAVTAVGTGGESVVVTGEMAAGDVVVIRGNEALQDGTPVNVVTMGGAASSPAAAPAGGPAAK